MACIAPAGSFSVQLNVLGSTQARTRQITLIASILFAPSMYDSPDTDSFTTLHHPDQASIARPNTHRAESLQHAGGAWRDTQIRPSPSNPALFGP
ncbi:hypothetical protein N7510_006980 [Penicillium lagena]|uniref:uncharacterized protein n=1 Tax=Penicillium lagena TaxID=94218 RepID=UPI00253F8289|nr:uncharacterized protein N7510_006980 [Penicillium lagena]KAJ5610261.1 hypothetical protein N7510_006980 [Penicillium lagena]